MEPQETLQQTKSQNIHEFDPQISLESIFLYIRSALSSNNIATNHTSNARSLHTGAQLGMHRMQIPR